MLIDFPTSWWELSIPSLTESLFSSSSICASDASVTAGSDCRALDFNIKFEQCILSLVPNLTLIVVLLLTYTSSLLSLLKTTNGHPLPQNSIGRWSVLTKRFDLLFGAKVLVALLLVAGDAATVKKMSEVEVLKGIKTTDASYGVQLASSVLLLFNSLLEHHLSASPSTLNIMFCLTRTLVGATQLRTFGFIDLQDGPTRPAFISLAIATGGVFLLMGLEIVEKRGLLDDEHKDTPRRSTASFVIKPFFFHLLPLLRLGARRKLLLSDLQAVPRHLLAQSAHVRLGQELAVGDQSKKIYLLSATFRAFGKAFLKPILPRALLMLATFGQVFLVQDMTQFVENLGTSDTRGWALVGGFVIVYTIIPVTTYLYWEAVFDVSVQYRSALVGSIYSKTLRLAMSSTRSIGQGAAATYMSVDVERVTDSLQVVHEMWVGVVSIGIACALLWFQAKWAMFAPLFVIVLFLGITSLFSKPVASTQKAWMGFIDKRIRLLSSVVNQLLPIKLGAYEEVFERKITAIRRAEVKALQRFYLWVMAASTMSNTGSTFASVACLGAYVLMQNHGVALELGPLNVSRVFTIVTILSLLEGPINTIGQDLPSIAAMLVSLRRIGGFLILAEKGDNSGHLVDGSEKNRIEKAADVTSDDLPISITNGSFGWEAGTPVLEDINMKLAQGDLHMVIGPVASGKSTLLMSLLGETLCLQGQVEVPGKRIAYASQTPFIFPGSVRSNIIFDRPFDGEWFQRVVQACGLETDIQRLPSGVETKLGERGVTLSGGQRQRLALARAVYAKPHVTLLDDTFSALDGETEATVFESLFGSDGLLRGKTVVLVTHALQHLTAADRIFVLQAGRISHVGTYDELNEAGAIADIQRPSSVTTAPNDCKDAPQDDADAKSEEFDDDQEHGDESRKARWATYKFYAKSIGFGTGIVFLGLLVLTNAIIVGTQGFLQKFSQSSGTNTGAWLAGYTVLSAAYAISQTVLLLQFTIYYIHNCCNFMHKAELDGVLRTSFSWLQSTPAGKILNRFSQDIQENDFAFPIAILNLAFAILNLTGILVFFILATPWLGLAFPVLLPAYLFIVRFYLATSTQLQHLEAGSKSPLYTLFSTTMAGLQNIRAYRAQSFFEDQNTHFLDTSQGPFFFRFEGQIFLRVVLSWMTTILAIGMSIIAVALRHSTSAALLGVALSQMTGLGMKLSYGLSAYASVENGSVSIQRIKEFADLPDEQPHPPMSIHSGEGPAQSWLSNGEVEFRDYSMQYREDLPPALKSLNLRVAAGEKIGICGRTGSGKSSMLLALFRATQQNLVTGQIVIDGVDTATVSLKDLRSSMCIVTQDPFLWRGTVWENIDVEGTHTEEKLWAALDAVDMKTAVSALPDKLDAELADEDSFSKGQRQLLCLARALLSNKKIIVLDESTSSMDHLTDERIRRVVERHMQEFTVFAIAHRISSIVHYDKILLLDHGSVMEFDTPSTLLSNPESRFARLAATQGIYSRGASFEDMPEVERDGEGSGLVGDETAFV